MLLPRTIPLLIHAPSPPDFLQCDPAYGRNIKPLDCQLAIEWDWPSGKTPVHYYFEDPSPSNAIRIPKINRQGTCNVAIEPAGPRYGKVNGFPSYLKHRPDELRALAGYVIEKCAHEKQGIGGFVTLGMDAAETYLRGVMNEDWENMKDWNDGIMNNGAFLTISINGVDRTAFMPGDTDPRVPAYFSNYAARLSHLFNEKLWQYQYIAFIYRWFAERMGRGGTLRWTAVPPLSYILEQAGDATRDVQQPDIDPHIDGRLIGLPGKMSYQCDSSLGGGPDPVDCEKLSWAGLKTPDAVETLQAGVPKFYSEGEPCDFFSHHKFSARMKRKERNVLAKQ